ncbi:peptidase S8 [Actinoplanes sp. NBRC 14428]|nr:peptidase S8 [Actinoplanes sp. NBRC 14428]
MLAAAVPAPARAAPAEPPPLPGPGNGCAGPSPVVAGDTSWAFKRVGPTGVWPLTRGAGVTVAVVDTGTSRAAAGLSGAVAAGTTVVGRGRGDSDCAGRGSALAGLVAARPVSGSLFAGVAPEARILPVRIVDGKGKVPPGALAAGIRAAAGAGAGVILIGVGVPAPDDALRSAVRLAVARDAVVVAAVSDRNAQEGRPPAPWYPASDPEVLAVGGLSASGARTERVAEGAGLDLLAPGERAYTVGPRGGGNYTVGGPAVAAAYVAGAAALVRAYHPGLGQAEVRRRLIATSEPSDGGVGVLDIYAAVADVAGPAVVVPGGSGGSVVLPTAAPPAPAKVIAGAVALGTAGAALGAYLIGLAVRSRRRLRRS